VKKKNQEALKKLESLAEIQTYKPKKKKKKKGGEKKNPTNLQLKAK